MDLQVESPNHDEGKINRLLEGSVQTFPGLTSLSQYFQAGLNADYETRRIDPDATAIIDDEIKHTFRELDELSAKMAEAIRQIANESYRNANPDQDIVIGVCLPPSDKLVLTLFAIMKLGGAYLPFEVSFPEDRVVKIVKDSRPVLIISDYHTNVLSKFESVKDSTRIVSISDVLSLADELDMSEEELKHTVPIPSSTPIWDKTAIVLYTSGSSGEPKGVRLNHRAIFNRLHWQWQKFPFTNEDRCVFKTSLTFVDSVAEIFGPLLQGRPLIVFSKATTTNPSIFIHTLDQYQITRLVLVPSLLRAMLQTLKLIGDEARDLLKTVKVWVCSGEALTKDLVNEFFENFPNGYTICNFYGSTEIMGDVTYVAFNSKHEVHLKALENHVPIGEPINNTVIYVLDQDLQMCLIDQLGEIYVGGYNLCKGYVGMSEHASFVTNPYSKTDGFNRLYRTGDFGKITETPGKIRTLVYEGRVDSQIKVRGQRVDLSEIEMVLSGIHLISKVKVLCYHSGQEDQAIVAFIVPVGDVHLDRIKTLIENRLRQYERPVLKILQDIPLLVNGKTDRQRLLSMYEQDQGSRTSFTIDWLALEIPENKVEVAKLVVTIMSEVTGTSAESIAENLSNSFFNIGGSSLNSIMVIMKLREQKCFISIPDFIGLKTIREIIYTAYIMDDDEQEEETSLKVSAEAELVYDCNYLTDADQEEACHIIAHSFSHHGDLEQYTDATYEDFQVLIRSIWEPLVEKQFSLMVRRKEDSKAVGVALNFDVYDEPSEIDACEGIGYVLEMLEFIESRQREKLPKGKGKLIHSFMMGTPEDIDESENVFIVQFMEERVIKMAEEKNFFGVMTTNTNALTQQIARDIHGYEVLTEYQVNKFLAPDGRKPFMLAPDSFKIICCWKKVGKHHLNAESIFFHDEIAPSTTSTLAEEEEKTEETEEN